MSVHAPQAKALKRVEEPCGFPGIVEGWDAEGAATRGDGAGEAGAGVVLVCEHASNALSGPWGGGGGDLGLDGSMMQAHIAWDPGALGLARGLAARMARHCRGALLVHAPLSRLIYDLNRAPDLPGAIAGAFGNPRHTGQCAAERRSAGGQDHRPLRALPTPP